MEVMESLFLGFVEAFSFEARECKYTYCFDINWTTSFFLFFIYRPSPQASPSKQLELAADSGAPALL